MNKPHRSLHPAARSSSSRSFVGYALITLAVASSGLCAQSAHATLPASGEARPAHGMKWPLMFEENKGQQPPEVRFISRAGHSQLFLTDDEAVLTLRAADNSAQSVVRLKLAGAAKAQSVRTEEETIAKVNYLRGNDPAKWQRNARTFSRVNFQQVYRGIDLTYYGNQEQLEYDFIVAPGADYRQIGFEITGADRVEVDAAGDLVLHTAAGEFRQRKPFTYQEVGAERHEILSRYVLENGKIVRFEVAAYDVQRPLVIDPIMTFFSHLEGVAPGNGTQVGVQGMQGMAVDAQGNVYVTGVVRSHDFPVLNPIRATRGSGTHDSFVAKFNSSGNLVFSTYFGGATGNNDAHSLALDNAGYIYVSGWTDSTDFPTTANGLDNTKAGPSADIFLTKLSNDGSTILYSTYYGGAADDFCYAMDVDAEGHAYLTGYTYSRDLPVTPNRFQTRFTPDSPGFQNKEAFVVEIDTTPDVCTPEQGYSCKESLIYGTLFGGNADEEGYAIRVASPGTVWVGGGADSLNFPTKNAYQSTLTVEYSEDSTGSGFIAKFNTRAPKGTEEEAENINSAESLLSSSYFGDGGGYLDVLDLVLDQGGNVIVSGGTIKRPGPFPLLNAFDADGGPIRGGNYPSIAREGFVSKFNPSCTALIFSTYLGGSGNEIEDSYALLGPFLGDGGLAVDIAGNVYATGTTRSTDFPLLNPLLNGGANRGGLENKDAFIVMLSPSGAGLVSSYLGGAGDEQAAAVAVDPTRATGTVYVAGITRSPDMASVPPRIAKKEPHPSFGHHQAAFLTRLALQSSGDTTPPTVVITSPAHQSSIGALTAINGTATDDLNGVGMMGAVGFTLYQNGDFWDGTQWSPTQILLFAQIQPNGAWSYTQLPTGGNARPGEYAISATAYDNAENASVPTSGVNNIIFRIDDTPPTLSISSPAKGATIETLNYNFNGAASDPAGIERVVLFLQRGSDGQFWNGTAWVPNALDANLGSVYDLNNQTWASVQTVQPDGNRLPMPGPDPVTQLTNGSYTFTAIAFDKAGNATQTNAAVTVDYFRRLVWTRGSYTDGVAGNEDDQWGNAANWAVDGVFGAFGIPGAGDFAVIELGHAITSDTSRTVAKFRMTAGSLNFSTAGTSLTITKGGVWIAGTLRTTLNIGAGATFEMSGAAIKDLGEGVTVNNSGFATWTGPGSLRGLGNSTWNNKPGSTFATATGGDVFDNFNPGNVFNNEAGALFLKNGSVAAPDASSQVDEWTFNNSGVIRSDDDLLRFSTLLNLNPGGSITHAGGLPGRISSIVDLVLTGTTTISNVTFEIAGGWRGNVAAGTAGNGAIATSGTGVLEWTAGTMQNTVNLAPGASVLLSGSAQKDLGPDAVLKNSGNVTWTGTGVFRGLGNSSFANLDGATFNALTDADMTNFNGGNKFTNASNAIFQKTSGSDVISCVWAFENQGTVLASSGALALAGGGTSSGNFVSTAPGAVRFTAGQHNLVSTVAFTGTGATQVLGGTLNAVNHVQSDITDGLLEIAGGTVTSAPAGSFSAFGFLKWSGGIIGGTFNLKPESVIELSGVASKDIADFGVINNFGAATWTAPGNLRGFGNSTWNNKAGSSFTLTTDGDVFGNFNGGNVFNNEPGAIFAKSTGAGGSASSTIDQWTFNNAGTLDSQQGALHFNTTLNLNAGASIAGAGRMLLGNVINLSAALNSTGHPELTGTLNGTTADASFAGSNPFIWSSGTISGSFTLAAGSILELTTASTKDLANAAAFINRGQVKWQGGGSLRGSQNSVFNNESGAIFDVMTDGDVFADFNNGNVFNNKAGALFLKSGRSGTPDAFTVVDQWTFNNNGVLRSDDGLLRFNTLLNLNLGGSITRTGALPARVSSTLDFILTGTTTISNATFEAAGGLWRGNLAEGTAGNGTIATSNGGLFEWTGGTAFNTVNIASGAAFLLSGVNSKDIGQGAVLNNNGNASWTGTGPIRGLGNSTFVNLAGGTLNALTDAGFTNFNGANAFINAGTFNIGNPLGVTQMLWSFTQSSTGRLNIDVAGTDAAAPQYDQLKITGAATLAGTIAIHLSGDYLPPAGSSFAVVTFGSRTGSFETLESLGAILDPQFSATALTFVAQQYPENNKEWRQYFFGDPNLPEAQPLADPNNNGVPNALEYALGRNPRMAGGAAISASATQADGNLTDSVTVNGIRYMSFTYTRPSGPAALTDVTYIPERAAGLQNPVWSGEIVEHSAVYDPATSLQTVTVRSTHPMTEGREFMHLRVTLAP